MPPLNRRAFLRTATLAAGGVFLPSSAPAAIEESETVPLGQGVNSATGMLQESALRFTPGSIGRGEAASQLTFHSRFERYAESLSMAISGGGSYGAFSLSSDFSKQHDLARDQLTVYCVVKREIRCQPQRAEAVKLTPDALQLFQDSPDDFIARHGDEYIASVVWGGGYLGVIALSCTSEEERDAWSEALEASFAGAKLTASASARISETWERFKKQTRLTARHVSYGVPHAFELSPPTLTGGNAQSDLGDLNSLIAHFVASSERTVVDAFEQGQYHPRQYYVPLTVQRRAYLQLIPGSAGSRLGQVRNRLQEDRKLLVKAQRRILAWQAARETTKQVMFHPEYFDISFNDLDLLVGSGIWDKRFRRAEDGSLYPALTERIEALTEQISAYAQNVNEQPAAAERPAIDLPEVDDIPVFRRTRGTPYIFRESLRNRILTFDPKTHKLFFTAARPRDLGQRWILEPAEGEGGYWLRSAQTRGMVVWKQQAAPNERWNDRLLVEEINEQDGTAPEGFRLLAFTIRPATTLTQGRNPALKALMLPLDFSKEAENFIQPYGENDGAPAGPRPIFFGSTGDSISWYFDPINPRDYS